MSNHQAPDDDQNKAVPASPQREDDKSADYQQTSYDEFTNRIDRLARRWRHRGSFNWGHGIQVCIFITASVYAAITFRLWRTTDASLREIQKQTRAQDIAFHLTHRPWLDVKVDVAEQLAFHEASATSPASYAAVSLRITMRNGGTAP